MSEGRSIADTLKVGDKVGEVEIGITEEMIDAYAAAVGDFNPIYMEKDTSGRRIAHPELLPKYAMAKLWEPTLDLMPNIRAKQAFTYYQPIRTGTKYKATGYVAEKYEKKGRLFITFEADFTDELGNIVLKDRRTQFILPQDFKMQK